MNIALLQEERYLPHYLGGNKSNRALLAALAHEGHQCLALCSVLLRTASPDQLRVEMARRGIEVNETGPGLFWYRDEAVEVHGMPRFAGAAARSKFLAERLARFQPDVVLVSSSPHTYLLETALRAAPDRVVYLAHSHHDLPFGPAAEENDLEKLRLLRCATAVVAVSRYQQSYLREYGGIESTMLHFPAYGQGPFAAMGRHDSGSVTLMNGSVSKGVDLFLQLAREFPDQEFTVIRWELDARTETEIGQLGNVRLVEPADNVDEIYRRTRVTLMPSMVEETFGLVAVESMLRGIPVLASDLGGLPEAKLGVDWVLPVRPAAFRNGEYVSAAQDITPWRNALGLLLSDRDAYQRCSSQSRAAAARFVAALSAGPFEDLFRSVQHRSPSPRPQAEPIAVVDPFDAGHFLAFELRRRGHPCVAVISNRHIDEEILAKCDRNTFVSMEKHNGDLAGTVEALRRQKVGAVLAGCETGVILADQLSEVMGFRSNGTELSATRRDKFCMAEAARSHGIEVPAQCCSHDLENLLDWARSWGKWPVVAKPPESLASDDVRLCRSEAEIEAHFSRIVGKRNIAGVINRGLIVQELMDATQYVVDTVSYEGAHYLAGVWRYGRPEFASDVLAALRTRTIWPLAVSHLNWDALAYGTIGSVSKELLPGDDEVARELFSYASRVLDAIGIRFGPCHFELMWTENGIRLVEVGARVHGAPQTHMMSRMCIGTSQIDQTIDAYLHPSRFLANARRAYSLRWRGMMFRLTPWRCGLLQGFRDFQRIERLASFYGTFVMAAPGARVPGCIGVVMLLHPDEEVLRRDCRAIRDLENGDLFVIDPPQEQVASYVGHQ